MKKLYSIKKSLAVGAMLLAGSAVSISAKTVYIVQDGIRYYWNNSKSYVEVTSPEKGSTYVGDIEIPASITYDDKNLPVTAVRSSAFTECAYLTSVVLPESVTSIGDYAFDTCEELKSVVMPGVKTIGHWSFRNCYKLEAWNFSDKLTSIGNYCFDKNYLITEATLPASVTNIGGYAFEGNPDLKTITCLAQTPPAIKKGYYDGEEVYTIFNDEDDYGDRKLYVPKGCVNAYKSALGWHHFRDNIFEIETAGIDDSIVSKNDFAVCNAGSGAVCISSDKDTEVSIIDINGRCIKNVKVSASDTVIEGLPSGIVLVNGIKVLVR